MYALYCSVLGLIIFVMLSNQAFADFTVSVISIQREIPFVSRITGAMTTSSHHAPQVMTVRQWAANVSIPAAVLHVHRSAPI